MVSWLAVVPLLVLTGAPDLQTGNPHLRLAIRQLEGFQEVAALRTLERARAWPKNGPHDLALVHLYSGLAHAELSHEQAAVESFRTALMLEADLQPPRDCSPRVREWFVRAGGTLPPSAPVPTPPAALAGPRAIQQPAGPSAPELPTRGERSAWDRGTTPPNSASSGRVWRRAGSGVLAVAATVALAGAVLHGLDARATSQRAQEQTHVGEARSLQREAERGARTANVLYASGGVLLTGAGLLFFW